MYPTIIDAADVAHRLERLKWNLWHGNVRRALQIIDLLEEDLDIDGAPFENGRKLHKAIQEFAHYIAVNRAFIPNLRRSLPAWRGNLNCFCRIDGESGCQ